MNNVSNQDVIGCNGGMSKGDLDMPRPSCSEQGYYLGRIAALEARISSLETELCESDLEIRINEIEARLFKLLGPHLRSNKNISRYGYLGIVIKDDR